MVGKAVERPRVRNPITGITGCCAIAPSGHATAAPPISVINSRRSIQYLVGAGYQVSGSVIPSALAAVGFVLASITRFARRYALKPQSGLRPIVGQTQESLSLLFGPSPGSPAEAISCVFVVFIDRGHGAFPFRSAGALPVSQPPTPEARRCQHHAPLGL